MHRHLTAYYNTTVPSEKNPIACKERTGETNSRLKHHLLTNNRYVLPTEYLRKRYSFLRPGEQLISGMKKKRNTLIK